MNWNRKYHFFLIFGDTTNDQAPWNRDTWKTNIQPKLDSLLRKSQFYKKTGLGSLQYVPKPNTDYYEIFKHGKLTWNDSSHEKWTLSATEQIRLFHGVDIWTPSRGVCLKIGSSPDIYFSIKNERQAYLLGHSEFEWFTVLAIAIDIQCDLNNFIIELSRSMSAKKTVGIQREWQEKIQDDQWQFINCIQDTHSFGIYKAAPNNLHKIPFKDIQFTPFWEIVFNE